MSPTEYDNKTATQLKRIAWLSSRDSGKVFKQLMHHFNQDSLRRCYHELDGRKAVGTDGVTKEYYGEALEENLKRLVTKMRQMAYRPAPVKEVQIPKGGGKEAKRALGISCLEDKLVQKMMQKVLESIYEPLFLPCSYGFRPGRGCHDAIRALSQYLYSQEVECVIEVDISNFFGTIDRCHLVAILERKIQDQRFLRYLHRMMKAGVLKSGELVVEDEGVVQGSAVSPILSNIYAHYVIDRWFEGVVRKHCHGKVELFRYCDDAVICCQYEGDAKRINKALVKRLAKYNLRLNEEKTRSVDFSKRQQRRGIKQGTFDFLGVTFYLGHARGGAVIPKVKTSKKRLRNKLKDLTCWIKQVRNQRPLKEIWPLFCAKLRGHYQYYGMSHNTKSLSEFCYRAERIMFKWLNRRSQRRSFNWEKFQLFVNRYPLPPVKIYHKLF